MSKKIKIFLLGCAMMVICCLGITVGATDNAKVIAHNLTITDEGISVNFYVDIDVEAHNDIKVTLNDSQVEIPAEPTEVIIDAKAYSCYKFTQPVVAKEMDDKVSLSIVAGEEELVTDSYSVNDYVAEVQQGGYGYNFENLANAMTYYGEFAEVYLKYNDATSASEKALASIDGFNADVLEAYAMTKGSEYPEGLTYYGTQLNLNSEITLRLCFQLADGKTATDYGNITAVSLDGTKDLGVLKKGSYKDTQYYYVDIANIGADALGKSYEIQADGKTLLSNCSVLSYAKAVVDKYGNDTAKVDLANLSKALYLYSEKANLYVESKLVAVYDIFYGSDGFSATPDALTPVYLTSNGDVTTASTGNEQVKTLSQLNDSRTKGCSVWMKEAYTPTEEVLTGPYVIRRYAGNTGNVLNVTGTATVNTKIDGSCGEFVAQYPNGTAEVSFSTAETVTADTSLVQVGENATFTIGQGGIIQNSHVQNGEVYVSGTLKVAGNAKSGVINASASTLEIIAEELTSDGEVVFPKHNTQGLTGTGEASAIKLLDNGAGHFGAIETTKATEDTLPNLTLGSIICVCGDNVSEDSEHSCAWTDEQEDGLQAAYNINWTATTSLPIGNGSFYLTQHVTNLTKRTDKNDNNNYVVNLDLNGKTVSGSGSSGNLYRIRKGTLNIADSQGDGAITMTEGTNTAGAVYVNGTAAYLNIFGGSISANAGTTVLVNTGCINMHGGTIIGSAKESEIVVSSTDTSLNFTGANAVQVGLMADATNSAELNIKGGTIKGEVLIGTNTVSSVTISGKAMVGIADKSNTDKAYGIGTSSLVTVAQTIHCEDVTSAKESIVLKDLEDVTISGTGFASAFKFIKDRAGHFGVYETPSATEGTLPTLNVGSVICGCGDNVSQDPTHSCGWVTAQGEVGIQAVYDLEWTATTSLPTSAGSYYLTASPEETTTTYCDMDNITINLDLAGHIVKDTGYQTTGEAYGMLYRVKGGTLNIADSSKEKKGKICMTGDRTYGGIGAWGTSKVAEAHINIYGGTLEAEYGTPIVLRKGYISMEGGTILPGEKVEGFTRANAVQVGIGNNGLTNLNVSGGTIKGEVLIYDTSNVTLAITGDAQVGIKENEQSEKPYGIGTANTITSAQTINFSDTSGEIVLKETNYLALAEGATGDASKITIVDKHNDVVNLNGSDTLGYAAYMCVCGKADGKYNHTDGCEQPAYVWKPWTDTATLPTTEGSHYLTADVNVTGTRNTITGGIKVNLDLAGYTVTGADATYQLYRLQNCTLNIADSSEAKTGTMKAIRKDDTDGQPGRIIYVWGSGTGGDDSYANIFGGTFDASEAKAPYGTAITISKGSVTMYDGTILAGSVVEGQANSVQIGFVAETNSILNVEGGTIYGEVLLGNDTATLTISDNAKVGIKDDNQPLYGIGTTSLVTSAKTITCDNVITDESVVIKNLDKVGVTGNGKASAFILLEPSRNTIIDDDGTLGYAAYMCVCGKMDGTYNHTDGCTGKAPDSPWQPWTQTTSLPNTEGSYYLTQNLEDIAAEGQIKAQGKVVNLDLAGYTIEGAETFTGFLFRVQTGTLNITDSSEKQTGAIKHTGTTNKNGAVSAWGGTNALTYLNIFGGTISAEAGTTVSVRQGHINMYGGSILPGTKMENYGGLDFTGANAVQVGILNTVKADLNVYGGTIKGEVLIGPNEKTEQIVNIFNNAKVGIADENDENKDYGIGTVSTVTNAQTIVCDEVSADASVVIQNSHDVTISGTGEESAFSIIDQHNKVVDDNAEGMGDLSFAPRMCVCGAVGEHAQIGDCAVPKSAWLPWNAAISRSSYDNVVKFPTTSFSYYLIADMTGEDAPTTNSALTSQKLTIDLAGHTVDASDKSNRLFILRGGTLNLTDSVGGGIIKNAPQNSANVYDGKVIWIHHTDTSCVNFYGGTLTADGTNVEGASNNGSTVAINTGTFNMYGGTVIDNGGESEDVFKAFNNHSKYNYVDGIVIEDGLYKRGDATNTFRAGYGKTNINPENGVSLGSYGDEATRLSEGILSDSEGILSDLEAVAIAVTDAENNTLILVVTDLSWGRIEDANAIRDKVCRKYGIPKENVLVGGTHNHSAPSAKWTENTLNVEYMEQWEENVMKAIDTAIRDRAEATMAVGKTETENMVFSRRYLSKDGTYMGGGGEYTTEDFKNAVAHESEADEQIQMLKFDRGEDKKPILITQWQSHACNVNGGSSEGEDHYKASGEWPQVIRRTLEKELGVHCMYMQGAAANLGSMSRIPDENLYYAESDPENGTIGYSDYVAIGEKVASYVSEAYEATDVFKEVDSGLIQINQYKMPVTLRYKTDKNGSVIQEEGPAEEANYPELNTVAIGDVSLVTLPSELFDTSAQYVKTNTPFSMTLIMGYTCGNVGYEAPDKYWDNGCYEVTNGYYIRGTAELMMQHYVNKLKEFYATK